MKNFWKNKPLKVKNHRSTFDPKSFRTILDKNTLLSQIQHEIDTRVELEYNILEYTDERVDNTIAFINANYLTRGSYITLEYSKDLYTYFCDTDNICIGFYPKKSAVDAQMVGFIMGKPIKLGIEGKEVDTLEVNFLCLIPQLRSLHISSYMISILSKVCLQKYGIVSAIYTVGKKLETESFCRKHYYHRPLDMIKMVACGLMSDVYASDVNRKVFATFNYKTTTSHTKIQYYNNITSFPTNEYKYIMEKLLTYNKSTYALFEFKTHSSIIGLFENPAFHTFAFQDCNGCITDLVSIYKLDTVDVTSNVRCRNGYVYCYFFEDDNVSYKFDIIERISEYCSKNNILDMITVMDSFGLTEKEYYNNKFLKGSGSLYYYFYNAEIIKVCPQKNGLVTI